MAIGPPDLPEAWYRLADDRDAEGLAGLGMDAGDVKVIDGRVTLWCGRDGELERIRAALHWVEWEMVGGRAAVVQHLTTP